jgi:hypothetical protein
MIQEEIKGGLKSRNACYHLVQNLLSSSLISKSLKDEVSSSGPFTPCGAYGIHEEFPVNTISSYPLDLIP